MSMTQSVILMALSLCASSGKADVNPDLNRFEPVAAVEMTKMRKLHLVRPDLIPIPLTYNVYC